MKNKILYFYNIYVTSIVHKTDSYYFNYYNDVYRLKLYDRSLDDLPLLYELNKEMIQSGFLIHEIIPTVKNELFIYYNNNVYVLLKMKRHSTLHVTVFDIVKFRFVPKNQDSKLNRSSWGSLWADKIDYFEYQFSQMDKKYPVVFDTINYFIGLWENAISYYNNIKIPSDSKNLMVCHRRITKNTTVSDLYDPLELVIDCKERDIADYIKGKFWGNEFINIIDVLKVVPYNQLNCSLLISRLLFPSYYFDIYEKIIKGESDSSELEDFIKKTDAFENLLSEVFNYYSKLGIVSIGWIQKKN